MSRTGHPAGSRSYTALPTGRYRAPAAQPTIAEGLRRGAVIVDVGFVSRLRSGGRSVALWEKRIDQLATPDEVVALTQDYLASFSPEYLGRLPADCRPEHIKYPDDIEFWAQRLSKAYCAEYDTPADGNLLHELLDYFLHALIRLAQLHRNLPGAERIKAQ